MIFDLRDYTTKPGMRDKLIEQCETVFFPEQVRLGAVFIGSFRDADDLNKFVWLRGMTDMSKRKEVLTAFYTDGDLWKSVRNEVNSWISDSDNVLLIRPLETGEKYEIDQSEIGMYSYLTNQPLTDSEITNRKSEIEVAVKMAGGRMLLTFTTDPIENNYPNHAIRTGEHGLIWFASFKKHKPLKLSHSLIRQRHLVPTPSSQIR